MGFPGVQKTTWTRDPVAKEYYFHRFYEFQPDLNTHNQKVRKEYIRLTGDVIDKAVFWPRYHDHAVRRHQVTHAGGSIGLSEAEASVTVAREFVQHVDSVRRTLLQGGRP